MNVSPVGVRNDFVCTLSTYRLVISFVTETKCWVFMMITHIV